MREQANTPGDLADSVRHYRGILKQRTRYYLAQRAAGVPATGAAILDLIILGNLEGCHIDVDTLSDITGLSRHAVRQEVVGLIRADWLAVRAGAVGTGLFATEKAAHFAEQWIGIAGGTAAERGAELIPIEMH